MKKCSGLTAWGSESVSIQPFLKVTAKPKAKPQQPTKILKLKAKNKAQEPSYQKAARQKLQSQTRGALKSGS